MRHLVIFLVLVGFAGIAYAESPPVIITQVELWGPESFHVDNIQYCIPGATYLGPWSVGWVELYNTQNKTITISDVVLKGSSWDEGFQPITLEPNQYCYLQTQDKFSTRVGPGGSFGNDPPPHNDVIITLKYSEQKIQHTFSTISLTDDYADTRTWQLIDGKWIFNEANIKFASTKLTLDSPLKQLYSGISPDEIICKADLELIQKKNGLAACVTSDTREKLIQRNWAADFPIKYIISDTYWAKTYLVHHTMCAHIGVWEQKEWHMSAWNMTDTDLEKIPIIKSMIEYNSRGLYSSSEYPITSTVVSDEIQNQYRQDFGNIANSKSDHGSTFWYNGKLYYTDFKIC